MLYHCILQDQEREAGDSKLLELGSNLEGNVNRWLLYNVPEISPSGRYEVLACVTRDGFGQPQAKMKCIAANCKSHAKTKGNAAILEYLSQRDSSPLGRKSRSSSFASDGGKSQSSFSLPTDLEEQAEDDVQEVAANSVDGSGDNKSNGDKNSNGEKDFPRL